MTQYRALNIPELGTGTALDIAVERAIGAELFDLTGARGGSLASFLVRLFDRQPTPIVVLTKDLAQARAMVQDLSYHSRFSSDRGGREQVLYFPDYEVGPYDELAPDRGLVMERSGALFELIHGGAWRFFVSTANAVSRKLLPRLAFEAASMSIEAGRMVDRDMLISRLEMGGYHHSPLVEEPGTYAVRGSLVDVFPLFGASGPDRFLGLGGGENTIV